MEMLIVATVQMKQDAITSAPCPVIGVVRKVGRVVLLNGFAIMKLTVPMESMKSYATYLSVLPTVSGTNLFKYVQEFRFNFCE